MVRSSIPDYLDGKLSAAEAENVQQHIAACAACAKEAEDLRPLLREQLPASREEDAHVDWARFSVELNAEIDRRQSHRRSLPLRVTVLIPVAATILAVAAIWLLTRQTPAPVDPAPSYAVTLSTSDVGGIAPEDVAGIIIEDITIAGASDDNVLVGRFGETLLLEDSIATAELRSALVDDLGFDAIVSATMEYFSTDAVIDAISDDDAALLASALEIQDIDLP